MHKHAHIHVNTCIYLDKCIIFELHDISLKSCLQVTKVTQQRIVPVPPSEEQSSLNIHQVPNLL